MMRFEPLCYEKVKLKVAHLFPTRAGGFVSDFFIPMNAVGIEIFVLIEKPLTLPIL